MTVCLQAETVERREKGRLNQQVDQNDAPYPIIEVDRDAALDVEQLGDRRKFWFRAEREAGKRFLFKYDDRVAGGSAKIGIGDDWAEKITCEVGQCLGIPHVHYELAVELSTGVPGVVCENIAPEPAYLVLGNVLLSAHDRSYPKDAEEKYRVSQHTIDAVREAVRRLERPHERFCNDLPSGIESASDIFVGYVMLDALVANQDRHHQNWGALRQGAKLSLAPTFDHGAALARNEPDNKRRRLIEGQDSRVTMESFVAKAKSGFFDRSGDRKPLTTLDAFMQFATHQPNPATAWLVRLDSLSQELIESIVNRIPSDRMTPLAREFTIKLIQANQRRLLEVKIEA